MRTLLILAALLAAISARAEEVLIPGPDGVGLRGVLFPAEPGQPPRRPVLALHGCGGLSPPGAPLRLPVREREWAQLLAAQGRTVLVLDSFGSRGLGPSCGIRGHGAPVALRRHDALAAAAWLAERAGGPPGGVLLLGWSQGGSTTLATIGDLPPGLVRAAVVFYPGCGPRTFRQQPSPQVPVLMLLGEADDWTPARFCKELAARHPDRVEMHAFPGAHHGFDRATPPQLTNLPSGQVVTQGGEPAARAAVLRLVPEFLARHDGVAR